MQNIINIDLTVEDLKNILILIGRVKDITGAEAQPVSNLQQKLFNYLPPEAVKEEKKEDVDNSVAKKTKKK